MLSKLVRRKSFGVRRLQDDDVCLPRPWSLLGQVPVVLRFTPQIAAPQGTRALVCAKSIRIVCSFRVTALRARLVLQARVLRLCKSSLAELVVAGKGVNVSNLELLSITGLPQVLEVTASNAQVSHCQCKLGPLSGGSLTWDAHSARSSGHTRACETEAREDPASLQGMLLQKA